MSANVKPLALDRDRVPEEMARYLATRLKGNRTETAAKLLAAYQNAGTFRRALVDSFTKDDIHRLCDVAIGMKEGEKPRGSVPTGNVG